ncbi:claudin 15-like a [Austrofundulus limnaeus]|uniref:Claudin n=1 Tax=Austrofundulus limnaeus TaxID=52670 RepID=A0A2I4CQZ7_AUSLI|nr:PREDICTED: claudin-15-like [Austrofundulus limnaeus]
MSTAVEATGFIMNVIAWLMTGAALSNDYWKISTVSGSVIISQRLFENLWHACAENSGGIAECRDFESMLSLPANVQAGRALMIISLLMGLACMVVSLLGLKCIKIGSAGDQSKAKMAGIGGILAILGGLCCMVACSWYGFQVVQDFNNPFYGGVKFELGAGLYMGWAAAALSILGGALLCTAFKRASPAAKAGNYPAKKIYTATARSEPETSKAYV